MCKLLETILIVLCAVSLVGCCSQDHLIISAGHFCKFSACNFSFREVVYSHFYLTMLAWEIASSFGKILGDGVYHLRRQLW